MDNAVCHDLKTERRDVSSGLPPALRFVPFVFYGGIVTCVVASVWFTFGHRQAKAESGRWADKKAQMETQTRTLEGEQKSIQKLNGRATVVAEWVDGAHSLQPLSVAISRSVGKDASIAEMLMTRNSEIPSQIRLTLKMDDMSTTVLDSTLDSIRKMSFRAYSAQQTKNGDSLDYNATLVWQESGR